MRIGPSHQAGSDSLLTASTFFKMRELYFNDTLDDPEFNGKLYGLGQTFSVQNGVAENVRAGTAATSQWDVIETLIQSAAIYSAALASLLGTYAAGSNAQYVCLDALQPLIVSRSPPFCVDLGLLRWILLRH